MASKKPEHDPTTLDTHAYQRGFNDRQMGRAKWHGISDDARLTEGFQVSYNIGWADGGPASERSEEE